MKKKILLISLMVVMLVCVLAISVGAYTPATSYNYYKDSIYGIDSQKIIWHLQGITL